MEKKSNKLKRELGIYKASGILDIVVAVIVWVFIAYLWGILEGIQTSLPWNAVIAFLIFIVLLGVLLLANGILTLYFIGKVDETFRK